MIIRAEGDGPQWRKVLVTGGSGFNGINLIRDLLERGDRPGRVRIGAEAVGSAAEFRQQFNRLGHAHNTEYGRA